MEEMVCSELKAVTEAVNGVKQPMRYVTGISGLLVCMLALSVHLVYLLLHNAAYFPVNTVKVTATYAHVSRQEMQSILSAHVPRGLYGISSRALRDDLLKLPWAQSVVIQRVWPDTLSIVLVEKTPVAVWNGQLITTEGDLIEGRNLSDEWDDLPRLHGPIAQQQALVQCHGQLQALLSAYGLNVASLSLRANQAWFLVLTNGVQLELGREDVVHRVERFCRAYPAVFAEQTDRVARVDLRYAHGMAVEWKPKAG